MIKRLPFQLIRVCLLISALLLPELMFGQCDSQVFTDKGIRELNKQGGYTYLKSYPVSGENGKKYSYIFSQGTNYMIALANRESDAKGIFITIFDSNKKEIATSRADGKFYPAVSFTCKRTGIYYLQFSFDNTREFCAAGVLGMRR